MKSLIIITIIVFITFFNCKKDDTPRSSILGSWNCEEFSESGKFNYAVSITRNNSFPDVDNEYIIYNFSRLGNTENSEVYVREIQKDTLTITGTVLNISITGKGIVANDFSSIDWDYQIHDGITNPIIKATYY